MKANKKSRKKEMWSIRWERRSSREGGERKKEPRLKKGETQEEKRWTKM